jgi:stage V sporulation protein G
MKITEVKVKLMSDKTDRLLAFCTITLDGEFVIRDLKIIEGTKGRFVAMPSRKLADKCPKCGGKNHLRAAYCNDCGARLNPQRAGQDDRGRAKLHADIAHPINQDCRERMQAAILEAYAHELDRSKQPGYVPPDLDHDLEDYEFDKVSTFFEGTTAQPPPPPAASPPPSPPPPPPPPPAERPEENKEEARSADDFAAGIF